MSTQHWTTDSNETNTKDFQKPSCYEDRYVASKIHEGRHWHADRMLYLHGGMSADPLGVWKSGLVDTLSIVANSIMQFAQYKSVQPTNFIRIIPFVKKIDTRSGSRPAKNGIEIRHRFWLDLGCQMQIKSQLKSNQVNSKVSSQSKT